MTADTELRKAAEGGHRCAVCGSPQTWQHDHRTDLSGLDDGPHLPGQKPRKKPEPRPALPRSLSRGSTRR